ncbi:hypothetical protein GWK47_000112 [Chionoecetes opilio]|uniref:Uncharacterized protein n=1 Tax=Chionoecetes opilio TaxID=41210 RepID=A0A8J4XXK7_CHIOP|nr:hypothetical protein GWK47_000112 [Chionoecetes opilio]
MYMAAAAVLIHKRRLQKMKPKKRTVWVSGSSTGLAMYGYYHYLMDELRTAHPEDYKRFARMDPELFEELVRRMGPRIKKQDTLFREALNPGLRLAIALMFLATGESY